jgi:serine/threonine protein kinase/ABC-type phosphate/phosphonate transport system substrate-binding protein
LSDTTETTTTEAFPLPYSFGDYELLEEVARGGMGKVYRARQKSLDRIVAVKMLLSRSQADFDTIRRFRVEAVAAGSLKHPNIVPIHEVGQYDGQRFIAMDYVVGGNLAEYAISPLPPKRAAELLVTISSAIHYAHRHRILHRDLKPSNILMDEAGQPHVTDFGLAKGLETSLGEESPDENHATVVLFQRRTADGQVLGSPAYMPPEQADGRKGAVGRYSDVYSLGAMLYHLLTGRPPFEGVSVADTLHRLLHDEVVSPRRLNASVPLDLETICLKCLEKDPARRYQTAQELAEELGRFLRDEPVLARPMGYPEKVCRWCRRNPMAAAFVLTLCVALGSSLALLDRVNRERKKQAALAKEVTDRERETRGLRKEQLKMTEEALESIWANREKRSMEVKSATIAAMAELPVQAVTNPATLVQWSMGVAAQDRPAARVRNYAPMISELEARASQRLGQEVRVNIRLYKFPEDFLADLYTNKVDFGRIAALPFVRSRKVQPALIPLAMPTTSYKQCVFFTRTNAGLRSIQDIRGRSVAFGDTNATISYLAQIQLMKNGLHATNLASFDFLDSTLEFEEEVHAAGFSNALSRIGYLHSHAQVIESVLSGRHEVGVARFKAFQIHEARGLAAIPGTEFESSRNLFVARPGLSPEFAQALISAITSLKGHWLEALPDQSPGYDVVRTNAYKLEEQWLDLIETVFPPKPSPLRIPVP